MKKMARKALKILIIVLLIYLVIGISYRLFKQSSLIGNYTTFYENTKHFLELKADNTYFHKMIDKDGKEYTNVGTWDLDHSSGEPRIHVKNFLYPQFGEVKTAGLWSLPITRSIFGNTQLQFTEDFVFSYSSPPDK